MTTRIENIAGVNKRKKYLAEFRRNRVENLLKNESLKFGQKSKTVRKLALHLDVTPWTIWQDLKHIESKSDNKTQHDKQKTPKDSINPTHDVKFSRKSQFKTVRTEHQYSLMGKNQDNPNNVTSDHMQTYNTNLVKPMLFNDGWKYLNLKNLKFYDTIEQAECGL